MFLTLMHVALQTCMRSPFSAFLLPPKWGSFSCVCNGALLGSILSFPYFHPFPLSGFFLLVLNHAHIASIFTANFFLPCPPEALTSQPDVMKELPYPFFTSLMFLNNLQSGFCPPCQGHMQTCRYADFFCKGPESIYIQL